MVRREVYLMSGGYYVSKETWRCEDYELFMRLYAQGFAAITCRNGCSVIGKTGPAMSGESFGIVWMKRESGGGILKPGNERAGGVALYHPAGGGRTDSDSFSDVHKTMAGEERGWVY